MSTAAAHPDQPADPGRSREETLERLRQHLGPEGYARLEEFLAAIRRGEHPHPARYGFEENSLYQIARERGIDISRWPKPPTA